MQEEHDELATTHDKLVSAPVLALTHNKRYSFLKVDLCYTQLGYRSMQEQPEGMKKPLSYRARMRNEAEQIFGTTQREALAVVWSVSLIQPCLKGLSSPFVLITMHWNGLLICQTPRANWRAGYLVYLNLSSILCIEVVSRPRLLTLWSQWRNLKGIRG